MKSPTKETNSHEGKSYKMYKKRRRIWMLISEIKLRLHVNTYISIPSAVRKIPLGALLIPRITIRSIHAAVVNWVFGFSRLQQGNTGGMISDSKIDPALIYIMWDNKQIWDLKKFRKQRVHPLAPSSAVYFQARLLTLGQSHRIATCSNFQKFRRGFSLDWQADEWDGLKISILKGDDKNTHHCNMSKGTAVCGKTAIHVLRKNKNNKATNNKFHMDDKIPESSVWRWRGMGLDAFLQGGTENILV